jgi:predicted transcriptional regulator
LCCIDIDRQDSNLIQDWLQHTITDLQSLEWHAGSEITLMADDTETLFKLTASIVSAYVKRNAVPSAELPKLIGQVHTALTRVSSGRGEALSDVLRPAVPIKKSIAPDYIICLEDGKKFKSLKRHLRTRYTLTPEQYREKWGLGSDYPMVAPKYAATRSRLAKQMRLSQQGSRRKAPILE